MKAYEYRHIVGFEETNLVGNVYYANHIKWQGRCREMFIKDKAPDVLSALEAGTLAMVTLNCACEYFGELKAFDEVLIKMYLEHTMQHRIGMLFEYYKVEGEQMQLVAKGSQEIGCMKRTDGKLLPVQIPASLERALKNYAVLI